MVANIAINGFGRIGRCAFRILSETPGMKVVAVNDLGDLDNLLYLLRHDTVYGAFEKEIVAEENDFFRMEGRRICALRERDPSKLPWKDLDIDIVLECTGALRRREDAAKHLQAGAKRVLLSAPPKGSDIPIVVHGVNSIDSSASILSAASCTTNCIAPVVEILGRRIGVQKALMTTVHAYTSSQELTDSAEKKWRRGRAAASNFVPTSTGAAQATTSVLPQYADRFDGISIRGPVLCGSISDIVLLTARSTSVEEVNQIFCEAAETGQYRGILGVTREELVSSDIRRDPRASVIDLAMTRVVDGDLVKVLSWYDNEWGYASQMVRVAAEMASNFSHGDNSCQTF